MKNKIFKILPIILVVSILISIIDIFVDVDYSNKMLNFFLGLDYNLLSLSSSLVIYAILSNDEKYEKLSFLGIFVCVFEIILSFVLVIIKPNNLDADFISIISKVRSISSSLETCVKYSGILMLIDVNNEKACGYRNLAIKTRIFMFVYSVIISLIDLDALWFKKISSASSVIDGIFYLFTILFLIERSKEVIEQKNQQNLFNQNTMMMNNQQSIMTQNIPMINNQQQFINQNTQVMTNVQSETNYNNIQ